MGKPYIEDPVIRSMRVRNWYQAVAAASGKTPAQLEREFTEREDPTRKSPRSCIWEKYRRGHVQPRAGNRKNGRPNVVDQVEGRYPGTASALMSPLWRLIDRAPMAPAEVRRHYEQLPSDICSLFVIPPTHSGGVFWRRHTHVGAVCDLLGRSSRTDALAALFTMVKEAEITQDQEQHRVASEVAQKWLEAHGKDCPLRYSLSEVLEYLNAVWADIGYIGDESEFSDLPLFR